MKPAFRLVDKNEEHPRDIAKRRIAEYQGDPPPPIVNIHGPEEGRAPFLDVDETLDKSGPGYLVGKEIKK